MTILLGITLFVLAIWLYRHYLFSRSLSRDPVLRPDSPGQLPEPAPLVSVIIPARNEETNLGPCLESLIVQDYPNFEILVFDDRSTDHTAEVVNRFAQTDSRIRLLRNGNTPAGWTGKNYVLHLAAQQARGRFFLFVDADTRHHPSSLSRSVAFALTHNVDLFSLITPLENLTFWEKAVQPIAGGILTMWYPVWKVNDPRSSVAFANGQYILFRREAYLKVGGHEAVRGELLEDIALAKLVKRAGLTLKVAYGLGIARARMYASLRQVRHGWARILFVGLHRSLLLLVVAFLMLMLFSVFPYVAAGVAVVHMLLTGPSLDAVLLLGASVLALAAVVGWIARLDHTFESSPLHALAHFPASLVLLWILADAVAIRLSARRLVWKGIHYETRPTRETDQDSDR